MFVSEKQIELTQQEKDYFYKYFFALIHKYNIPLAFDKVHNKNNTYTFIFIPTTEINGRNINKDRVIDFSGVFFSVRKNIGYLDVTDWNKETTKIKDFDNAPQFQYSVQIVPCGYIKPYKKQKPQGIFVKDSYQYGTDFNDINLDNAVYELYKKLSII